MGLGLGMSFISVIEILYYIFFRRFFLRHRSTRSRQISVYPNQAKKIAQPIPCLEEFKKFIHHEKRLQKSSNIQTISSPKQVTLHRRGSLDIPSNLQSRFMKY